jgi:ribonuclease E
LSREGKRRGVGREKREKRDGGEKEGGREGGREGGKEGERKGGRGGGREEWKEGRWEMVQHVRTLV